MIKKLSITLLLLFFWHIPTHSMDGNEDSKVAPQLWQLRPDVKIALGLEPVAVAEAAESHSKKRPFREDEVIDSYGAIDIANYFLALDFKRRAEKADGMDITPLKLQKLLYYAQAYYLALFDTILFDEDFSKWENGPVVVSVAQPFSRRSIGITHNQVIGPAHCGLATAEETLSKMVQRYLHKIKNEVERNFLSVVYNMYLHVSGEALSAKTHLERPWRETDHKEIITKDLIVGFFRGPPAFEFIGSAIQSGVYGDESPLRFLYSIRGFLMNGTQEGLEEYKTALDNLVEKITPYTATLFRMLGKKEAEAAFCFVEQTEAQAILGQILFPDFLETSFELPSVYFNHRTIPTLLAFSARYNNPIACFYLAKMFDEYEYPEAAENFLQKAQNSFSATYTSQSALPPMSANKDLIGVSLFYLAEIQKQQGEWAEADRIFTGAQEFLSQSQNPSRLLQLAKQVKDESLKKTLLSSAYRGGDGHPDAAVVLASLSLDNVEKSNLLQDTILRGSVQACFTMGGLMLQEDPTSVEAISLLKEAIKRGSYGAALHLAQQVPSQAETAYDLALSVGFQNAGYQKYQLLVAKGAVEEAKSSLSLAGILLHDEELLDSFTDTEKDQLSDDVETYLETLSAIAGFDLAALSRSGSSGSGEDELAELVGTEA